jgi:uncharacterized membrane protein
VRFSTKQITQAALIAAAYAVLTLAFTPISFGLVQFRVSEALMLLSALTPAAIPGLFIGCILANLFGGLGIADIAFGSIATLLAAILTYYGGRKIPIRMKRIKPFLLPVPTILFNGIIVGGYLPFVIPEIRGMAESLGTVLALSIGSVMLGELVVTYLIGIPMFLAIRRTKIFINDEGL